MVKAPKTVVLCFCTVAILFVVAVLLSTCGVRQNVHDNGAGADAIRTELTDVRGTLEEQGRILKESQEAITNSERATDELAKIESDDARIIRECRGILEAIRKRNET